MLGFFLFFSLFWGCRENRVEVGECKGRSFKSSYCNGLERTVVWIKVVMVKGVGEILNIF